jgi:N-acyl-D-amino-acid deacylase
MKNQLHLVFIYFLLLLPPLSILGQNPPFDLLIKNGKVVDGTGNPWIRADVAVKNGRIVGIGNYESSTANKVVDAKGLVVAPGFIDVHTHSEDGVFRVPTADNFILDGVTTLVTGNCGGSADNLGLFFDKIKKQGVSVNVSSLIGHNTVRRQIMGTVMRDPTPEEQQKMEALVEKAMQQGAVGLATGLIYIPGTYAKTAEIVGLAKIAAKHGGIYASHMRDEGDSVKYAIEEALTIGREAQIPVEISHFKLAYKPFWGKSVETIAQVEKARQEGIDVNVDQYPYTASSTNLGVLVRSWALADGDSAIRRRFETPSVRKEILDQMMEDLKANSFKDYSYAVIARFRGDSTYNGKTISEVNILRGRKATPREEAETILDLLKAGGAQMIYHKMSEEDVENILRYPNTMIASDAGIQTFGFASTHPRSYGTNARVLGRYVRERKVIPLEDAIRRMTSLPAQRFKFHDRGLLRENMAADIVIFDEKTVADKATYDKPHAYSVGFQWVIVNGQVVIEAGKQLGTLSGQVLYGKGFKQP